MLRTSVARSPASTIRRLNRRPGKAAFIELTGGKALIERTVEQGAGTWKRVPWALLVLAALALWLPVSRAEAAPSTQKLIWGPPDEKSFDTYADLGAGL